MRYTSIKNISLEQIQFFLMIARLQSFTEAAEVLCVSQPMLSRRISMLEQEVGFQLFNREKRQIRLTADGEWLYTKWSDLIGQFEETLETAYQRKMSSRPRINIGCDEMLWPVDAFLFPLIEPLQSANTGVDLNLECFDYPRLRHRLSHGMVDVIITGSSDKPVENEGLRWRTLASLPNHVGISCRNPLAQKDAICWEDLRDEYFLILSAATSEDYYNSVVGMCRQHGFEPKTRSYANKASIILNLKLNNGVHVGSPFGFYDDEDSVRLFALPGRPTNLFVGWREDAQTNAFVDRLCAMAEKTYPQKI